jgi:hypothetical protein
MTIHAKEKIGLRVDGHCITPCLAPRIIPRHLKVEAESDHLLGSGSGQIEVGCIDMAAMHAWLRGASLC